MHAIKALVAAATVAAMLPAAAAQFDFYKLGRGTADALNKDFLPIDGVPCTNGDLCSSNVNGGVRDGDLQFMDGGILARATGSYKNGVAAVVQDHENQWTVARGAGLGVYHMTGDSSDDNITFDEMLTISFDRVVRVTRLELRAEGHNFTGWHNGATFLFDGVPTALPKGTGFTNPDKTGSVFAFAFDPAFGPGQQLRGDQFYLAAMTVETVPEPGSYALFAVALGALGFVTRRRKPARSSAGPHDMRFQDTGLMGGTGRQSPAPAGRQTRALP
jgi:PEP-CTERM motif